MARRKRASMREGPLADLFRSTVPQEGEGEQPTEQQRVPERPPASPSEEPPTFFDQEEAGAPAPPAAEPSARREPEPEPPDPERVRAYRMEDMPAVPPAKERLTRIFADDSHDVEGPTYGRDEPGLADYHGPPRPHLPIIRVVGVGGAGVNAI